MQILLVAGSSVTLLFCALMVTLLWRARGPKDDPFRKRTRPGKPHRAWLAAAAVFPGAFLFAWLASSSTFESSLGVVLGWIPALMVAALLSAGAYGAVQICRRAIRTQVTVGLAIVANSAYAAALWAYVKMMA